MRFQPESLDDAMVSKVVPDAFPQVAPRRTLSLRWPGGDDEHVLVSLRGRAPDELLPPRVALRVQTTSVPAGTDAGDLDWEHASGHPPDVTSPTFFTLLVPDNPDGDGNLLWEQVVTLPAPRGTQRMRLEVAEYELLRSNSEFGRGLPRITCAAHLALD